MKIQINTKQILIDLAKSLVVSLFLSFIVLCDFYVEERYKLNNIVFDKTLKCFATIFVLSQIIFFILRRFIPNFSDLIINCLKNNHKQNTNKLKFSTNDFISFFKERYISILVFLFAVFMMLHNLMHSPLWGDEWVEYSISQQSILSGQLFRSCGNTFQPPLYNIMMHFWLLINKDLLWFRIFNVLISAFSLLYFFKTIKILYNVFIANISVISLSVVYMWIYTVQECSEYCLMLHFTFASIYYFVCATRYRNIRYTLLFILTSVLAIYSQYGSALFVIPLLIVFAFREMFVVKEINRTIFLIYSYIFCLIFFAFPLYIIFLKRQLAGNEIFENAQIFSFTFLNELPFAFGQLFGYFSKTRDLFYLENFWSVFSITLIALIILLSLKKISFEKKVLMIGSLIAYFIYFVLVKPHIYGMVHANQSSGLYSRYAVYLLPIFIISCIIIIIESKEYISNNICNFAIRLLFSCLTLCLFFSFNITLRNWEKTNDFKMIKIYSDKQGYKDDMTFVIGEGTLGFPYYTRQLNPKYLIIYDNISKIDTNNLPDKFWFYRTDWSDRCYDNLIERIGEIKELGYKTDEYFNDRTNQLICFFK